MASTNDQLLKATQQARAELLAALGSKDVIYNDLNDYVTRYRSSCEALILNDFETALHREIEQKLWDGHVRVNKRYQKLLSMTRVNDGKKTPVEYRKNAKRYLEFIKASQRFYRAYISKLASTFGGIPELEVVAHDLKLDITPAVTHPTLLQSSRRAILLSCHQTIIRLGDLSRYRETEMAGNEPNWGPAIGYYDLAGSIYPQSGVSHNQLAVVARQREQHLGALYHLYRALAAEESHPMAKSNLELEFKKIVTALPEDVISLPGLIGSPHRSVKALEYVFMRLHAQCSKGVDFAEHDELENEVLSQLAVELKEHALEGLLNKSVLINITAQYHASEEFQSGLSNPQEKMRALLFYLRLNVRTFFTLLQLLQSELEPNPVDDSDPALTNRSGTITAVARRILPALRQYSSWLITNLPLLVQVDRVGDNALEVQVKEMWKMYANTLTIMARSFDVASLPVLEYLLEEDENTICFRPFRDDTSSRYCPEGETNLKPTFRCQGVERQHPNFEMAGRIRDFLTVGTRLAVQEQYNDVPIDLSNGDFVYREEGVPSELLASPGARQATLTATCVQRDEIPQSNGSRRAEDLSMTDDQFSHAPSSMVNMVNKIVQDEPMDSGDAGRLTNGDYESSLRPAGNETSYGTFGTITAADLVKELRSFSTPQASPRPYIPSIINSPFAPLADNEEAPLSRPGTVKHHTPSNSQQHFQYGIIGNSPNGYTHQKSTFSQQQPNGDHSVESSMSSITDSVGGGHIQWVPVKGPLTTHSPRNYDINYEESKFMSSNMFGGSSWIRGSTQAEIMSTPPNGQGNGSGRMSSSDFDGSSWNCGSKQGGIMPMPPNGQGNGSGG